MAEDSDTTFYAKTPTGTWLEISPDIQKLEGAWEDFRGWELHSQVALMADYYGLEISATQTIKVTLTPTEAQEYLP